MSLNKINSFIDVDLFFQKYFLKNTLTNNYVLAETYREVINAGKLFYYETASNVFLLVEKENFYQLYFFLNNLNENVHLVTDKPITMEIVYRGAQNKPLDLIRFWERNEFKEHLTRDNFSLIHGKLNQIELNKTSVQLKYAETTEEAYLVKQLFEGALDKYTGDLMSINEIFTFINNKNIICAYLGNQFCGALQFEVKNNIIWLGHIVTDLNFRGNGIANLLVKKYIEDNTLGDQSRYQLWVINDNIAAKSLYTKFGFIYTNKSTTSLLKL